MHLSRDRYERNTGRLFVVWRENDDFNRRACGGDGRAVASGYRDGPQAPDQNLGERLDHEQQQKKLSHLDGLQRLYIIGGYFFSEIEKFVDENTTLMVCLFHMCRQNANLYRTAPNSSLTNSKILLVLVFTFLSIFLLDRFLQFHETIVPNGCR